MGTAMKRSLCLARIMLGADMNACHVWVIVKHEGCSHVKYGRKFVQLKLNNGGDVIVANIGAKVPLLVSVRSGECWSDS
jgi:Fe-S cluster assembly iron-binding protein IscA